MSFYEFFALFDDRRRLFGTVFLVVGTLIGLLYFFQPQRYTHELWLTVTRTQVAPTPEYAYDHYYRFQADERLAESLTAFLSGEAGKQMIGEKAKLDDAAYQWFLTTKLTVTRQGTNEIKIVYQTKTIDQGGRLGEAMLASANAYVFALNEDANQKEWFTVIGSQPATGNARWGIERFIALGFLGGFLVAFWSVVLHFFWGEYQIWRSRERIA